LERSHHGINCHHIPLRSSLSFLSSLFSLSSVLYLLRVIYNLEFNGFVVRFTLLVLVLMLIIYYFLFWLPKLEVDLLLVYLNVLTFKSIHPMLCVHSLLLNFILFSCHWFPYKRMLYYLYCLNKTYTHVYQDILRTYRLRLLGTVF
jgi:hypothetical protein